MFAGDRAALVFAFYRALYSHKRAAMDFCARTEMDKHTLDAHSEYKRAVEAFVTHWRQKRHWMNLPTLIITGRSALTWQLQVAIDELRSNADLKLSAA
jgi:hypothetical protein